jgi:UDP-N-acetylmuramoylalanine--D-glutamate ligase
VAIRATRPGLPEGPFLVAGLARSGEAVALALRARGEEVIGCDAGSPQKPGLGEVAGRLSSAGVEVHLDASGEALAARARTLVKSPGVPRTAPVVRAALRLGLPVLGELELAWRMLPNPFVAVTGTNGKTTTTEWIGHIHRTAGVEVAVAGNVGTALSSLVGTISRGATVICESSSFQLEDAEAFAPEVAVLLNLSPDHLDRHGTFEEYSAAKLRIFARQGREDAAIVPDDLGFQVPGQARRVPVGSSPDAALRLCGGQLQWHGQPVLAAGEVRLPGEHNLQNAMAAAAACLSRGLESEAVAEGLRTFAGVSHRLELVTVHGGVSYVNDSKATNVASTIVALRSYASGVHLIAGGQGKGQDFSPLARPVAERCAAVYLIGEDAGRMEDELAAAGAGVPLRRCGELFRALDWARREARPGDVVLLSPACASFDQYRDFEARGDHFRALVAAVAPSGTGG